MLLSCGITPDGGILDEVTLTCCSSWNSICATGTKSGHVYLWNILRVDENSNESSHEQELVPFCVLIPNSICPARLIGMVFVLSPSPLLQSCTDELLLTLHSDNVLRYWSLDNGRCIAQLSESADHEVLQLVSLADKRFVLLVGHQRITIIDTWSRLNCGALKIASCPYSKRKVNNRIDDDTPDMYKIQSPTTVQLYEDKNENNLQNKPANIYGEYGESMIFNVSTNHDYFELLKWSSNISLFDYCEDNRYPTAHFYTVAAMLNTGQVLVWDLSNLIRIWWHFIPIPHCEIPCPVPKPQKNNVPKPFMKYSQDENGFFNSAKNPSRTPNHSQDQIILEDNLGDLDVKHEQNKLESSAEEIKSSSLESHDHILESNSNASDHSKSNSLDIPNIYQLHSLRSPMLAPTFFSLHPCFVSEPINFYSIPSSEMFSTQIVVTDLYLIVNAKYRLIIWKRTFLPQFQNRTQRYQPFGDLFVPNTPRSEDLNMDDLQTATEMQSPCKLAEHKDSYTNQKTPLKRASTLNAINQSRESPDTKHKLHIWLGFSQISFSMKRSCINKSKTLSPIRTLSMEYEEKQKHFTSFLAWSSDFTIYNIQIPSIVCFLFSQNFNPKFESNVAFYEHDITEIDNFGSYNDLLAIPILASSDNIRISDRDQLNCLGHLASYWQFFKVNTLHDSDMDDSPKSGRNIDFNSQIQGNGNIIWLHRNNVRLILENNREIPHSTNCIPFEQSSDRIFYTFLDLFDLGSKQTLPANYKFPLIPNKHPLSGYEADDSHSFIINNVQISDSKNIFFPIKTNPDTQNTVESVNDTPEGRSTKYGGFWRSTKSLSSVWEDDLTDYDKKNISVLACCITEQRGSIYCIISLSNGKIMGQCLTGEFGLLSTMNCNEDNHFFGNIENGVVYKLPMPSNVCKHKSKVVEIKSITDGCIFGLTCCGNVLIWRVDLMDCHLSRFSSIESSNKDDFRSLYQNNSESSARTKHISENRAQTTYNYLFSLIACVDGLFFTKFISLHKVIVFDVNRLGELGTPKYDKFQILVHSSLERKCVLIKVNNNQQNFAYNNNEQNLANKCIWDEGKDQVSMETQGVTYETLSLSLEVERRQDSIDSRINSVAIDKPSNFIFILQKDIIFIYDKDTHLLLAKVSFNCIFELKECEYQNSHLSYGLISSLNSFIQTSNKIEFLDHGIMFGSVLIGQMPDLDYQKEDSHSPTCLGVRSNMSISFMAFNPHVSADVVSIEKKRQKHTKTSRYLQHLFPLFVRSTNEFLSKLFADMAPLTVRPILKFSTLITGVNYAISIPIHSTLRKPTNSSKPQMKSRLWDSAEYYFNISEIKNTNNRRRYGSVDRSRNIYSGSKESIIRSHTYDGTGNPPYRYLVSENWSENIKRHLDTKTMSVRTLKNRLNVLDSKNIINSCPGRPFCEWSRLPGKKKNFEVDTNDYYIGELSGIPCTSHLVNRIVRSRNSGINKRLSKFSSQTLRENIDSKSLLQRGETFDSRSLIKRDSTDIYETSMHLFRSRTYESTLNFSNGPINEFPSFDNSDRLWLERFLNQRNINDKSLSEKLMGHKSLSEKTLGAEDPVESCSVCELEYFRQDMARESHEHFSAHQLALQMVILHYYFTYYSNLDLPIQLLDKFLLSWIIEHVEQQKLLVRFIPFHLFSITGMTLDVFSPYLRLSAKYCLQLAIRSLPSEVLSYCEEIAIDTLSGIIREFLRISVSTANRDGKDDSLHILEQDITACSKLDVSGAVSSTLGSEIKSIPPWNESCRRGHPKIYSYCSISLCRMIGYRLPFPIMNSGEYYCSNLSIEDLSLFFLSIVLYEHPFKRTHSSCIGKIILSFLISIITTYDIEVIIKFSKNFDKLHLEKKRLLKPIYARRQDTEQWYSWENLNIDSRGSNITNGLSNSGSFGGFGGQRISGYKENSNYDSNSYYNNISIMDTLRFLFALELFSLNFTSLLKTKNIENTCVPSLLRNSLTSWENNIFMAAHIFQVDNGGVKDKSESPADKKLSYNISNSIICLCIRLLTLAQYPPFWTSCRHLLQLIGQLDPKTYIYILGYAGRTAYPFMGINYTCNVLSLLVYFVSSFPEYSFPYLNMVVDISIGFLDPLDSTLRKGTITAVTSVLFILVSAFPMITFHQNTQRFAIGFDRSIIVYDLRTATKWRVLQGHTHQVDALCFNKEGEFLASYSIAERALRIWQCTQSGLLGGLLGISGNCIKTIDLSEIPSRTLNCSLFYRLKVVKISCKNTDEWQLRRENKRTYTITIDKS